MLEIDVIMTETFDDAKNQFVADQTVRVNLEHSLFSLSKWESIWEEPFLGSKDKNDKQTISYIALMIVGEEPSPEVFAILINKHLSEIQEYIGRKMTATKIADIKSSGNREIITAEIIYHWMVSMQIPFETQYWHLNRLITLIRVISLKNDPNKKKMTAAERHALNRKRLAKYGNQR